MSLPTSTSLAASLAAQPLALLFLTIGVGAFFARLQWRGVGLGVAAVLFVGLALGAWGGAGFELPAMVGNVGLVLFVYAIGLESGAPFVRMARKNGLALAALGLTAIAPLAAAAWLAVRWLGVRPELAAGMFCGAGTNTPALAAVAQQVPDPALAGLATVGYALAYPLGVLVPLVVAEAALRLGHADIAADVRRAEALTGTTSEPPHASSLVVQDPATIGHKIGTGPLAELPVRISRVQRDDHIVVPNGETVLARGDVLHVVGTAEALAAASAVVGPEAAPGADPEAAHEAVNFRRVILSNHALAGRRVDELDFDPAWEAVVTRVRRGDLDFVPTRATLLELGDRVRVVARPEALEAISRHLGDSSRALGELDLVPLAAGLVLGVALGAVRLPVGGGLAVQLGVAGGPLLVALVLGAISRTGPINWRLPPTTSLAVKQLGLAIFLSYVGLRAGHQFAAALTPQSVALMALAGAATLAAALLLVLGARFMLRFDWVSALGALAGGQTQPALLAYAQERSRSDVCSVSYAAMLPACMFGKIVVAQLLTYWLVP